MSRTSRAALAVALVAALFLAFMAMGTGGRVLTRWVDDMAMMLAAGAASAMCVWAARRGAGRAWWMFAAWTGLWAVGQGVWNVYELILGDEIPFPSLSDVFFLSAVPFALLGLLLVPAGWRATRAARSVLDGVMIALSLVGAAWAPLLAPLARQRTGSLAFALGLAYPVLDVILVVVALWVAEHSLPGHRRPLAYLVAGVVSVGAADAAFGALAATGRYETGNLWDTGWVLGFLLVAVAAVAAVDHRNDGPAPETETLHAWLAATPFLPLVVLLISAGTEQLVAGHLNPVIVFCAIPVGILTVARQVLIHVDNARLAARLRAEVARHRAAEAQLVDAQRLAAIGSWEATLVDGRVWWSDEHYRILGYEPGGTQPGLATVLVHVHPDDHAAFAGHIARSHHTTGASAVECRILTKDGQERWIHHTITPAVTEDGIVVGLHGTIQDTTERRVAERRIRETASQLAIAQHVAHLGSWTWDLDTGVVAWSDEEFRIFGLEPGQIEPTYDAFIAIVHPEEREEVRARTSRVPETQLFEEMTNRIVRPDGEVRWIRSQATVIRSEEGTRLVVGTSLDITDAHRAEQHLLEAELRFRQGFEHSPVGMAMIDIDGRVTSANPAFCRVVQRDIDDVVGRNTAAFLHPDNAIEPGGLRKLLLEGEQDSVEAEARLVRSDGAAVWTHITMSLIRDGSGEPAYFFAQIQDVTARRQAESRLAHQAGHDMLTGSANRVALIAALEEAVPSGAALVALDLDSFKDINDGLGHEVGDLVLQEVAKRLRDSTRPGDVVARVGGDEFAVLLSGVDDVDLAERIATTLVQNVERPLAVEGITLHIGAAAGIAVAGHGAPDAGTVLRRADVAMQRARRDGAGLAVYRSSDDKDLAARVSLVGDLRAAIDAGGIGLHYQPKIDVGTGDVVGVEALARWTHPERGVVPPSEFIALAEQTGLIIPLTRRLLDEALGQMRYWRAEGIDIDICVNLSPRVLLDESLINWVSAAVVSHDFPTRRLVFEITESSLAEGEEAVRAMSALQKLGVRLSIDDLGTGYSSLLYLKNLPVDELKVDRAFIQHLADDVRDQAIVTAIVALGNALGLSVVAEGVEDERSLDVLRRLGCPVAQGYHCCRPQPASEMTTWLSERATEQPADSL